MLSNIEIFGYMAMTVVIASILMKDMAKLRLLGILSSAMFIIYGLVLSAYPIVLMNVLVIAINTYRLLKDK